MLNWLHVYITIKVLIYWYDLDLAGNCADLATTKHERKLIASNETE